VRGRFLRALHHNAWRQVPACAGFKGLARSRDREPGGGRILPQPGGLQAVVRASLIRAIAREGQGAGQGISGAAGVSKCEWLICRAEPTLMQAAFGRPRDGRERLLVAFRLVAAHPSPLRHAPSGPFELLRLTCRCAIGGSWPQWCRRA